MTIEQLSVDDNARAYTSAEGNDDKVLHAACHTIDHLSDSCCIGIVGQCYRDVVQTLAEELRQGNHTVVSPGQVRSKLNRTLIIVAVRRTDTHCLDFLNAAYLVDNDLQCFNTGIHIVFCLFVITCFDSRSSLDLTTGINDSKYGVGAS